MIYQEFISQNLFLADHEGLRKFIHCFVETLKTDPKNNSKFSIVCERTEDLYSIQKQVFIELKSILGIEPEIFGGLSFYTLDKLGQSFCSFLSLSDVYQFNYDTAKFGSRPYIDIKKQEQIVSFLLNLFHVPVQGSRTLAKQILALLDLPLPPDINLAETLFNALNIKRKRTYKDIPELFLKQLLAIFQASRIVLNRYSRLQTLVCDLVPRLNDTLDTLESVVIPKFLSGTLLWVAAPEYQSDCSIDKTFKSGEFLNSVVDDLFHFICKIREKSLDCNNERFFYQRTLLKSGEPSKKSFEHIGFYCAETRREFYQASCLLAKNQDASEIVITGEFDSNSFQTIHPDGHGAYQLSYRDFVNWQTRQTDNIFSLKLSEQLDQRYDEFLDTVSYIENHSKLQDIAKIYSIPMRDMTDAQLNDIFFSIVSSETFVFFPNETLSNFPKKYEFYASSFLPSKLTVVWDNSHFEKNDFSTRVLNQMFSYLQSQGVDIDNPFTEKSFTLFWKHIFCLIEQKPIQIDFVVSSPQSLDVFPIEFKKIKYLPLSMRQFPNINSSVSISSRKQEFYPESYVKYDEIKMQEIFNRISFDHISTTQFETYVRCPFQFFLEHGLDLKKNQEEDFFSVDNKALGIKVHKICDILLSRMVQIFGNDGYVFSAPQIYQAVLSALQSPDVFLNADVNVWKSALDFLPADQKAIFFEICDEIFCADEDTHLKSTLFIELLKRTLFKFLQTEIKTITNGLKYRVGIVREYPFEITLNGLAIRGRIDRVDINTNGYEIIDYKVSAVSKGDKVLCILPEEIQSLKSKAIGSIQGALYVLAFGQKIFDINESEQRFSAFSLYRLKNIKHEDEAILSYSFLPTNENNSAQDSCISGMTQMMSIERALSPYAENFINKNFFPNPILKKQTCQYCHFTKICPRFLTEYDSL